MLEKAIVYNETYSAELLDIHLDLDIGQDTYLKKLILKELIFGLNLTEEEYARESLGKLKMDLLYQLGIYTESY